MAIFQPRPFQTPNLRTDYSAENSAWQNLGKTLGDLPGDLRKQQLEQQKQQLLGSLTSGSPDYTKVGLGLVALGDTQGGASLLALGQKQLERDAYKSSPLSGGTVQPTLAQPSAPLGSATISRPRGVQVAETEDDVQRLEAEMAGRSQAGNPAQPRGLRNNNPGNIEAGRFAATVQGFQGSDGRFARYETPEQGIQAADKLLQSYAGRGLNTVNGIVNRWAPPTENNTGAYVASVAKELGVSPDQPLDMSNPEVRQRLIAAKIRVENGRQPYGEEVFQRAYAGNGAPVQVAEAAPQPNAPMADAPAPGAGFVSGPATTQAAQAQGFAIPGTSLPPNDPRPGVSNQQLIEILGNPYLKDQHPIAKYILDARQKYTDENAPDKREMTRLQTEKARREAQGEQFTDLVTPEERAAAGVDPNYKGPVQRERSGRLTYPGKPTTEVNMTAEKAQDSTIGKAYGEYFVESQKGGRDARDQITTLKRMQSVMDNPDFYSGWNGGRATAFKKLAVGLGIKDAEAAAPNELFDKLSKQAVLDKAGGSFGTGFSNGDRDYIDATTANINNTPEGNRQIIDMALKVAQRRVETARMAREYAKANGGRLDAGFDDQMADYAEKNPLFPQASAPAQSAPNAVQQPSPQPTQPTTPPRRGVLEDGYRFKGGDPSKPENWVKVR